jgi:fluoride ion exporter CrcB/FEX
VFSVIVCGSAGCVLRWLLGLFPGMPLGTLFANLVGGLIIGGAMVLFIRWPNLYQRNASTYCPILGFRRPACTHGGAVASVTLL